MTQLKGPDGNTYAVAQGALSIGGFSVTVGRIVNGAQVEKELKYNFNSKMGPISYTFQNDGI